MKKLIHILFLFISINVNAAWINTPSPTGTVVRSIAISGNIYFASNSAGIYYSNDYGATWSLVNTGLTNTSVRHILINGSAVYIATGGGVFISNITTTSAGISWSPFNTGLTSSNIIYLANNGNTFYAGTNDAGIFRSVNGASWTQINSGLTVNTVRRILINGSSIYIGSDKGVFLSTNNGDTWVHKNNTGLAVPSTGLDLILHSSKLWMGSDSGIYSSSDEGNTWTKVSSGLPVGISMRLVSDGINLYASNSVTNSGTVYLLQNNYWTSKSHSLPISGIIVTYLSGSTLFVGNADGQIWKRPLSEFQNLIPPSNLTASSVATTQINLSWTDNSNDEQKFTIFRSHTDDHGYTTTATYNSTINSYNNTGLPSGTRYSYKVRAENDRDHSPYSNVLSVITIPVTHPIMGVDQITETGFRLSVASSVGASEYHIDLSTDNFATYLPGFEGKVITAAFVNVTGLTPGTKYSFRYRPANESGEGVNSPTFTANTFSAPIALPASSIEEGSFKAHWKPVLNAKEYSIELSSDDFASVIRTDQFISDTFYTFNFISSGTAYKYRVKAKSLEDYNSSNSNLISVTTLAPITAPSLGLYPGNNVIQLNWLYGKNYNRVDIEKSIGTNNNYVTIASNITSALYDDLITQSGHYFYRVKVYNIFNEFAYTNEAEINFTVSGVKDQNASFFKIYPNPSEGNLTLEFNQPIGIMEFRITNLLGELIYNEVMTSATQGLRIEKDLSNLDHGMYHLEIIEYTTRKRTSTLFIKK